MAVVRLRALGECALETDAGRIGPDSKYVFALGLYLVLERGKRIPRQALVDMLWPDVRSDSQARHRFRQTLLRLKQYGVPVTTEQSHLRLDRTVVMADFDALLAANGEAEELVSTRDSFEFLYGYQPRISEQFASWLDLHRARVELSIQRTFVHALKSARTRGDWSALEQLALACLRIDPLNEEATIARAEATAMRGSKAQALRILDSYMDALGERSLSLGLPARMLRSRIAERITQPQYTMLSEAHFVGREEEIALLTGMLDEAKQGRGNAILFVGAAGIGKTRLVTEISSIASLKGAAIAAVHCQPTSADRPIGLLADLVTALRGMPGSLGASVESLSLLQRLTEYTDPPPPTPEFGEAGASGAAVRRAVFDLFEAVAEESPLLVTVEDVHWSDAFSWRMVKTLAESAPRRPVLIVATAREEPRIQDTVGNGLADPFHVRTLPPLDATASYALLEKLIADFGSEIPGDMLAWCVSVAEGNPYYLRELLTRWLETHEPFGVPKSLAELVDRRLTRTSHDALRVFHTCVALGSLSTVARLELAETAGPAQLATALDELSHAGLITSDGTHVLPTHDLLAQAARDRLPPALKTLIHGRVATILESDGLLDAEPGTLWACAHHWERAGQVARAVALLDNYGRHLLSVGFPEEAASLYNRALDLEAPSPDQRMELQLGLIRALHQQGLMEQELAQIAVLREWASMFGKPLEPHSDLELQEVEARLRLEAATETALRRLAICVSSPDASSAHRLKAAFWVLAIAHSTGDPHAAHAAWAHTQSLIEDTNEDPIYRYPLAMIYHTDYGDMAKAVRYAHLSVEQARTRGEATVLLRILRNAALTLRRAGRHDEARALLHEAFALATRRHAALWAVDCAYLHAAIALDEEDNATAREWLDRADEWVAKCEGPLLAPNGLMTKVRLAIACGDWEAAAEGVERLPDWRDQRNVRWKQMIVSLQLVVALQDGSPGGDELLSEAELCYAVLGTLGQQDCAVECLAYAYQLRGQLDSCRDLINDYLTARRRDRGAITTALARIATQVGAEVPEDYLPARQSLVSWTTA